MRDGAYVRSQRNTEPAALSSAVSTDRAPWASRPSALDLWRRHEPTRAPCSVRSRNYATDRDKHKSPILAWPLLARTSPSTPRRRRPSGPDGARSSARSRAGTAPSSRRLTSLAILRHARLKNQPGGVAERSNAAVSKTVIRASGSEVQILSPPLAELDPAWLCGVPAHRSLLRGVGQSAGRHG